MPCKRSLLNVIADAKTKVYGDADPALTYQVSGLKNGDTAGAVLNGGSLSRVAGENVGVYGVEGDLALAGLELLRAHRGVGVDGEDQVVDLHLVRLPVVLVALEADLRILLVAAAPATPTVNLSNGSSLSGTAEPGSTVILTDGNGNPIAEVTADGSGNWTYTPSTPIANGTDWTIGHVHAGALGWVAMVSIGSLYHLIPKVFGREKMYSLGLINAHFWLATIGTVLYIARSTG